MILYDVISVIICTIKIIVNFLKVLFRQDLLLSLKQIF